MPRIEIDQVRKSFDLQLQAQIRQAIIAHLEHISPAVATMTDFYNLSALPASVETIAVGAVVVDLVGRGKIEFTTDHKYRLVRASQK